MVILVAEDDGVACGQLVRLFTEEGYEVLWASNGAKALEIIRAREGRIDVLFTDNAMPMMFGVELIKVVKHEFPHVKTILFSSDSRIVELAKESGADRYHPKLSLKDPCELVHGLLKGEANEKETGCV